MRIIKLLGLVPILAILASFPGCSSAGAMITEDLRQSILTSGDDITSYRFTGTLNMSASGQTEFDVSADFSGALDLEDMNMNMTMSMDIMESSMDMEMYMIVDDRQQASPSFTAYMQAEMDGEPTGWVSMELPYSEWEAQMQLDQQLENYSFAEVRHAGEETIDGTDCYILDIILDADKMIEFAMEQPGMEDTLEGIPSSEFNDVINNMAIKEWVSKDTNLPVKMHMSFGMTMEGDTVDMDMTMRLYDYNEPIEIALPAGINAQPIDV